MSLVAEQTRTSSARTARRRRVGADFVWERVLKVARLRKELLLVFAGTLEAGRFSYLECIGTVMYFISEVLEGYE